MELAPQGTTDPTPFLYDSSMYTAAGALCIALAANAIIRPVNARYHMRKGDERPGSVVNKETQKV